MWGALAHHQLLGGRSDIFKFFLLGEGRGPGSPDSEAPGGGGGDRFFIESPRRGGGGLQDGSGRGPGRGELGDFWGGAKYFL